MKVDNSAIVLTGGMYHEFSVKEYSNLTGQVKIYKLCEICQSVGLKKNVFLALYLQLQKSKRQKGKRQQKQKAKR